MSSFRPPRRTIPDNAANTIRHIPSAQFRDRLLLSLSAGGWELPVRKQQQRHATSTALDSQLSHHNTETISPPSPQPERRSHGQPDPDLQAQQLPELLPPLSPSLALKSSLQRPSELSSNGSLRRSHRKLPRQQLSAQPSQQPPHFPPTDQSEITTSSKTNNIQQSETQFVSTPENKMRHSQRNVENMSTKLPRRVASSPLNTQFMGFSPSPLSDDEDHNTVTEENDHEIPPKLIPLGPIPHAELGSPQSTPVRGGRYGKRKSNARILEQDPLSSRSKRKRVPAHVEESQHPPCNDKLCTKCNRPISPPQGHRPFRHANQVGVGTGHGAKVKEYCIRDESDVSDVLMDDDDEKDSDYRP